MRISDWSSDVCSSDLLFVAAVLAALAAAPLVVDDFILVLLVDILVLALFAASLHFLLSIGGLVSFGHAAFYGGGAYAAALMVTYAATPFELRSAEHTSELQSIMRKSYAVFFLKKQTTSQHRS